jgi:microcystin-dependent protein
MEFYVPCRFCGLIYGTAPNGLVVCDESATSLTLLDPLFNFKTPYIRGRVVVGTGQGQGHSLRILGETGGSNMSGQEIPTHSHDLLVGASGDLQLPAGVFPRRNIATNGGLFVNMSLRAKPKR